MQLALTPSLAHPAAVLAITFGSTPSTAFSGGLDKRVRQWDLQTGQCRVLGKHEDAVSSMVWCEDFGELNVALATNGMARQS
jgi:cell cycle arrest protein BUB3